MPSSWKDLLKEVKKGSVRPPRERLEELGYATADDEVVRNVVGDSTKEAIRKVQRRLGLRPTGEFDEAAAKALDRTPLPVPADAGCIVRGRILQPDGEPVVGAQVRAFDKQLRGDPIDLGHATTDARAGSLFVTAVSSCVRRTAAIDGGPQER